ncbi:hypothetical protein SAMN05216275_14251 [Streptosporangium canum]|uniref:Uncharacterized protein n=1 Tax=Streptosporangium canum TaxID=324952 RepID=A0A1I4DR47_9ACTN|nr:hypothetical protein SAMN05216275_14251 [Streptosporangium canum]
MRELNAGADTETHRKALLAALERLRHLSETDPVLRPLTGSTLPAPYVQQR